MGRDPCRSVKCVSEPAGGSGAPIGDQLINGAGCGRPRAGPGTRLCSAALAVAGWWAGPAPRLALPRPRHSVGGVPGHRTRPAGPQAPPQWQGLRGPCQLPGGCVALFGRPSSAHARYNNDSQGPKACLGRGRTCAKSSCSRVRDGPCGCTRRNWGRRCDRKGAGDCETNAWETGGRIWKYMQYVKTKFARCKFNRIACNPPERRRSLQHGKLWAGAPACRLCCRSNAFSWAEQASVWAPSPRQSRQGSLAFARSRAAAGIGCAAQLPPSACSFAAQAARSSLSLLLVSPSGFPPAA